MTRAKGQPTLTEMEPETRTESNVAPPAPLPGKTGLARFGLNVQAVATPYWHPPDAREKREPLRIGDVLYWWPGEGEKRFKTLPNGKQAQVLAIFGIELKDGGKRVWECLSSRALAAVNDVPDPSQWFTIHSKGTQTDKTFTAKPWKDDDGSDAE